MPRDGSGVYSKPAGTTASPNVVIESAKYNAFCDDLVTDANAARPLTAGGTAATTAVGGADNLSTQGTAIASATTTDIGAATGRYVHITGTTTITGLGTKTAGVVRMLTFDGALILTHNATSLILPGAANITTAAGDTALFVSEGSGNWRCLAYQRAATIPPMELGHPLLHVRDEKAATTVGGGLTGGTTNTRTINTVVTNEVSGASIGSNQIILPAGTYYCEASAPGFAVGRHRLILTNASDGVMIFAGQGNVATVASNVQTSATLSCRFTLAATKSLYIDHWAETTNGTTGGGAAMSDSRVEVYAEARFWKLK